MALARQPETRTAPPASPAKARTRFPSSSASAITADNQLCSQRGTECGTFVTLSNQAAVPFRIRSIAVTLQFNREPACAKTKLARNKMATKALEKRTVKRTKMVVAVRFPKPQPHAPDLLVHTLDISSVGAKIGALREWVQPGSVLLIQRRHTRARCRVTWSRRIGPQEVQIGIEFLGRDPGFWGLDLDDYCAGLWISQSER